MNQRHCTAGRPERSAGVRRVTDKDLLDADDVTDEEQVEDEEAEERNVEAPARKRNRQPHSRTLASQLRFRQSCCRVTWTARVWNAHGNHATFRIIGWRQSCIQTRAAQVRPESH